MLDKVRARIAGNRDERGRYISKSNGKTEAAGLRQTFTLGRDRIKLAGTSDVERAALALVQSHARVAMRNKLGLARGLAQKYPLFEGVKKGLTPAERRAAKRSAAKANVAARSAYLRDAGNVAVIFVLGLLVALTFWGAVGFVALHFLARVW